MHADLAPARSLLVKAWSYTSFPAYKSRLGWMKEADPPK